LPPLMADDPAGRFDQGPREDRQEGDPGSLRQSIPDRGGWVATGRRGRLSHGDLLGVRTDGRFQTVSLLTKGVASHSPALTLKSSSRNALPFPRAIRVRTLSRPAESIRPERTQA